MRGKCISLMAAMMLLGATNAGAALAGEGRPNTAAPSCEITSTEEDGVRIFAAGAWEAECREGRGCAIRGPEVRGHRLQLSHPVEDAHWNVVLSLPGEADAQAGVELVVDAGEPMRIPYEFLRVAAEGRVIGIRPEVVDIVLEALRKGRRLEWRYMDKAGKSLSETFDIACLGAGGLLERAEKSLAQMRAMKQLGK